MTQAGAEIDVLAREFAIWKSRGRYGRNTSWLFGKDGPYNRPLVTEKAMMHVHLVPLADPAALVEWNKAWATRSSKSSDRALVYVADKTHGYLLIWILEIDAHEVARMKTTDDRELMHQFTRVAEDFVKDGTIGA